jgi:outer membrane protein assembly factor BamB
LWRIHASVLFANEDGFVAETPHGLADLDPATGTARWTVRLSYGRLAGADATPHLLEGRGSRSLGFIETNVIRGPSLKPGHVPQTRPTILETAVDLDTADVRWQLALPNDVHLFTGKNVFGFNNDHRLVALDASTGSELWQRSYAAGSNHSAILAANATIYINAILGARSKITALDARTGAVRWEATGKGNVALAAPHDGMLYTAGGPEHFALDPHNGHALWTYSRRIIPQAIQRDRLFATRNAHRYDVGD